MDPYPAKRRFPCAVCGCESHLRSGWFLVAENSWLDRLKVLSWHPVLAEQTAMLSVCGKRHLKTVITQWLTEANLPGSPSTEPTWAIPSENAPPEDEAHPVAAGKLVGELAVQRESRSNLWTGSPEALECILDALIGGMDSGPICPSVPLVDRVLEYCAGYAFDEVLTDA